MRIYSTLSVRIWKLHLSFGFLLRMRWFSFSLCVCRYIAGGVRGARGTRYARCALRIGVVLFCYFVCQFFVSSLGACVYSLCVRVCVHVCMYVCRRICLCAYA